MNPIRLINIWGSELPPGSWVREGMLLDRVELFRECCQTILANSRHEDHGIYPKIRLDAGYATLLEVGILPHGWRLSIVIPSELPGNYWSFRRDHAPAPFDGKWIEFMSPEHSSYPEEELLDPTWVCGAVEEWSVRKSITISIKK